MMNQRPKKNPSEKERPTFAQINANAAGIDIGSGEHWVCVPPERSCNHVRRFGCFTPDLIAMAEWLSECGVDTVVMESTGVYWIPAFQILETKGIEVRLVNAHYVKTVPGRKSDILDCQWLQQLHTYGLLSGSFRPDDQVCVLRSYIRQRDSLIKSSSVHVQRMQKALTQMNLQLHKVISDITGVTGMAIIRAIVAGQRNPQVLAALKNPRIRSSTQEIVKALTGDYRAEHIFVLKQELQLYEMYHAFRLAAQSLCRSQSALGAFYRRLRSRLGAAKANTAAAHKLARIFYQLWHTKTAYTDSGADYYEQKYQQRLVNKLQKTAQSFGFQLVPKTQAEV
jgi:hypothetical protein